MRKTIRAAAFWPKPWTGPPEDGGAITLGDGMIAAVEDAAPSGGLLLVPGLVNAHDHGRGLSPLAVGAADGPLEAWLWDLRRMPPADPYLNAVVAFGRMALSGVTTVVHNHLPQGPDMVAEAKAVARAARDIGVKLGFVVPVLDRNLAGYDDGRAIRALLPPEDWREIRAAQAFPPLGEQMAAARSVADAIDGPGVVTQLGPPGPQWLSEIGWASVGEAASNGWRTHVHLLETRLQRDWLDTGCNDGAAAFFERAGLLNDRLTIAHGVFLRRGELAAFADAGATLVLNPGSNLRLASGIADGVKLAACGIRLGIGLDGMAIDDDADMLREVRLAAKLLGPRRFDAPGLSCGTVLRAAFADGRVAYDGTVASGLEEGGEADVVGLSLKAIASDRVDDSPETLAALALGRWNRSAVREVWAGGRRIVADGRLTGVDLEAAEAELTASARSAAKPPGWIARARAACVAAATGRGV